MTPEKHAQALAASQSLEEHARAVRYLIARHASPDEIRDGIDALHAWLVDVERFAVEGAV